MRRSESTGVIGNITKKTAYVNRRGLDNFPEIIARLTGIIDRFATALDCIDTAFIADTTLEDLPLPSRLGATRTSGIDLNKPRIRA